MKKFLGISAIVFLCAIPAHAQGKFTGGSAGSLNNTGPLSFGGGGMGGSVSSNTSHLPDYPRARFSTAAVTGDSSFLPSSFMTFEQAVAEGIAESAPGKSIAQAAADNQAATKAKARVEFVQDHSGNVIPVTR